MFLCIFISSLSKKEIEIIVFIIICIIKIKPQNFPIKGILETVKLSPFILLLKKTSIEGQKNLPKVMPFFFSCEFVNQIIFTEPISLILALARECKLCQCGLHRGERNKGTEIEMFFT